jgi:hypothetical protein
MNAAIKHLRSPFHAVRVAAHKEIQAILHKRRGFKRRLQDRLLKPAARKVTPASLHRRLGLAAPASKGRRHAAPAPGTPWRRHTPMSGPLTNPDLKEREKALKRGERLRPPPARAKGSGQPARQPDLLKQAGLVPPAQRAPAQRLARAVTETERLTSQYRDEAARARSEHDFGRAQELETAARKAEARSHPQPARRAPEIRSQPVPAAKDGAPPFARRPDEFVPRERTREKGRWARLDRSSRSRTA